MAPPRRRVPELMDAPGVEPAALEHGLSDLRGVNRWLGGAHTARGAILPLIRRLGSREVRVLDVATGSGDIPLSLSRRAAREGLRVRITATDIHPATLAAARSHTAADPNVQVETADALALPYGDGAFDLAMCHTALHHFDEATAARVLRELNRVARFGLVVTDLARSTPALLGARILAATVWRGHPVTRHDGPHSVAAAFTASEMAELATAAGIPNARVTLRPVFRLALVADRTGSG